MGTKLAAVLSSVEGSLLVVNNGVLLGVPLVSVDGAGVYIPVGPELNAVLGCEEGAPLSLLIASVGCTDSKAEGIDVGTELCNKG